MVQIRVKFRKALVHVVTNFSSLQRPGRSQNRDLRERFKGRERAPFVNIVRLEDPEGRVRAHEIKHLGLDHLDVGPEVVQRKRDLDEFLLFHEQFVRTIVDNVFPENGGSQGLVMRCVSKNQAQA